MGLFRKKAEIIMEYKDYDDTYENLPFYKTCNMTLANMFPNNEYNCCAKVELDVFVKDYENGIISQAEIAHVNTVESMVRQFADVLYAGTGIVCSKACAYVIFYIPEKSVKKVADIFSTLFQSSFRHCKTNIFKDPEGKEYFRSLYPDVQQVRLMEIENIMKKLSSYGDDGSLPRDIKYIINFDTKDSVVAFASNAFKNGFEYVDMIKESIDDRVLPIFKLILKTNMPFNTNLVNEKVRYIINLAEKFSGDYKGVETDIVEA